MPHSRLYTAAGIIAVLVLVGFALSVPHAREVPAPSPAASPAPLAPTVTLRDVFKKGNHTLSGSVLAPNACTAVSAQASLAGDASTTERIILALQMPSDSGICLQLPTRVDFSAAIAAPENLPIDVTVNGAAAQATAL